MGSSDASGDKGLYREVIMAQKVTGKSEILEEAGYSYNFDRMVYVNRAAKKAFSVEFIEDHTENEIQRRLHEETNGQWRFYFNVEPPRAVKVELENVLG
jgi:hypothetical protein